jgi:hypothetical protein
MTWRWHLLAAGVDMHGVHGPRVDVPALGPDSDPVEQANGIRLACESSPIASVATRTQR